MLHGTPIPTRLGKAALQLAGLTGGQLAWAAVVYVVGVIASLIAIVFILVELPATYFLDDTERHLWVDQHPIVRLLLRLLKNLIGLCLVLVGILLCVPGIPGQGLLTVLVGVMLLDFPGKRRWERRLVSPPRVHAAINRLRNRFGKPPLQLDPGPNGQSPPDDP